MKIAIVVAVVLCVALGIVVLANQLGWGRGGGGEQTPRETNPPEVYITIEPFLPEHGDYITFIAAADDASGVDTIAIFVNNENIGQCHGSRMETHLSCSSTQGPYSQGQTLQYFAYAVDYEGNSAESNTRTTIIGP
jgi:hypothetical protein